MEKVGGKLTVFFEDPFWVGVFEKIEGGKVPAAKVVFGAEPKDYEVQDFVLKHYYSLQFSPAVAVDVKEKPVNPKRRRREAKRHLLDNGIGTKSQQALKLQQEQSKQKRKVKGRKQKQANMKRMFELKQQKKKDKHKGH